MNELRVLLYARVSSAAQKRSSQATRDEPSLGQQTQEMQREAARRGWSIIACLEDVISGSVAVKERPGGALIYEQAAEDAFDLLMFYDNDRIGRDEDGVVAKIFRADMRLLAKQLFSVHQPVDPKPPAEYRPYEDDSALWLESVSDTASSVYIRQFRRRHAFGMRNRITQKKLMAGSVPTGYVADRHVLPNGRVVLGERRLDPVYAPLVQRIYNEYETGQSGSQIAGMLNREGLRSPKGHLWSVSTIRNIINSPIYYGATVYYRTRSCGKQAARSQQLPKRQNLPQERWLIVEDAEHPAIITKAQWEHCQALKRSRTHRGRTHGGSTLLSGLVYCGKCGGTMLRNGGWGSGYFSCSRYYRTGKVACTRNSIKRDVLEEQVVAYLERLAQSPAILKKLQVQQTGEAAVRLEQECQGAATQLAQVEGRLAKVREAYEAGVDTMAEYARRKEALAKEQTELTHQVSELDRQLQLARQQQERQQSLHSLMSQFAERFQTKPLRLQKLLLRELIEQVQIDDGGVKILFKTAPFVSSDYERTMVIVRAYSEGQTTEE